MNTIRQKIAKLSSKEYRDAFVGSQISVGIPFQIRALREQRGWKQADLAGRTGMLQPRISAMEAPGGAKFTLETLRRLASAFDVALMVKFVPFSELGRWSWQFNPESFAVQSFEEEIAAGNFEETKIVATHNITTTGFTTYTGNLCVGGSYSTVTPIDLQPLETDIAVGAWYQTAVVGDIEPRWKSIVASSSYVPRKSLQTAPSGERLAGDLAEVR